MRLEFLLCTLLTLVVAANEDRGRRKQKRAVKIINRNLLRDHGNEKLSSGHKEDTSGHVTNRKLGRMKEASAELLEMFGLEIPTNIQEFHGHGKKPPKYMVDLYNEIADHNGISRSPHLLDADTVRSVPNTDTSCPLRCYFDLRHVPPHEIATDAELHVFMDKQRSVKRKEISCVIKIFQVVSSDKNNQTQRVLVAARRLPVHSHGWQIFPLLHTVETWSSGQLGNLINQGLVIETSHDYRYDVTKQQRHNKRSKQPILVIFTRDKNRSRRETQKRTTQLLHKDKMAIMRQQFLLSTYKRPKRDISDNDLLPGLRKLAKDHYPDAKYQLLKKPLAEDGDEIKSGVKHLKLSRDNASLFDQKLYNDDTMDFQSDSSAGGYDYASNTDSSRFPSFSLSNAESSFRSCRRYPLYVDFEELGWSGWIIHPMGYNAYHCRGTCDFPLGQYLKPSNHAIVQSIMHTLRLGGQPVEMPSCTPDKLYDINLLYFDRNEYVVLRRYEDMVAGSCACR